MDYSTGNHAADKVAEINFSGNIIPSAWFQTVVKADKGKPYLLAIMILSEIVYWYKPVEVRDEATGEFRGYRTKFKGKMLQKSYKDLAAYYQVTKRQVTDAVVFLETLGVIKRVFKTVRNKDNILCNNVLFIDLIPDRLKELTYPGMKKPPELNKKDGSDSVDNVDNVDKNTPLSRKNVIGCHEKTGEPVPKKRETNTEIIKENTYNSISILSHPNELGQGGATTAFKKQIAYDEIRYDYLEKKNDMAVDVLDTAVSVAVSVYFSSGRYQIVGGRKHLTVNVKKILSTMTMFHMRYVIDGFLNTEKEVKNVRAYLLACMVNSVHTLKAHEANEFSRARLRET